MDAHFSLAASEFIRKERRMSEMAASTCFFAATNHEILSGKIKGRLHRRGDFPARSPIRDLYDIVVAAQADPGVVGRVLQGVTPKGRSVIADDLRRLPDNLHETDPKPLMNAKCRFPLHGLPRTVAAAIESGDEALLPKAVRVAQDSDLRGGP